MLVFETEMKQHVENGQWYEAWMVSMPKLYKNVMIQIYAIIVLVNKKCQLYTTLTF